MAIKIKSTNDSAYGDTASGKGGSAETLYAKSDTVNYGNEPKTIGTINVQNDQDPTKNANVTVKIGACPLHITSAGKDSDRTNGKTKSQTHAANTITTDPITLYTNARLFKIEKIPLGSGSQSNIYAWNNSGSGTDNLGNAYKELFINEVLVNGTKVTGSPDTSRETVVTFDVVSLLNSTDVGSAEQYPVSVSFRLSAENNDNETIIRKYKIAAYNRTGENYTIDSSYSNVVLTFTQTGKDINLTVSGSELVDNVLTLSYTGAAKSFTVTSDSAWSASVV